MKKRVYSPKPKHRQYNTILQWNWWPLSRKQLLDVKEFPKVYFATVQLMPNKSSDKVGWFDTSRKRKKEKERRLMVSVRHVWRSFTLLCHLTFNFCPSFPFSNLLTQLYLTLTLSAIKIKLSAITNSHSFIRNTSSLSTFRNKLKTHFFTAAYTWRDIPTTAPLYLVIDRLHGALQVWFYVMLCLSQFFSFL